MAFKGLKRGAVAVHEEIAREDARIETARQAMTGLRRFWLPQDKDSRITFLDGDLDEETGLLDVMCYYEHNVYLNGNWRNWFVCIEDEEPCPLCQEMDMGNKQVTRSLVFPFTIIDHDVWTDRNGNTHQDEKRLFVAKRDTFKRLSKMASKRGGLTGVTFDVSRVGERSPAVGSDFDFVEQQSIKKVAKKYGLNKSDLVPATYDDEIIYKSASELRKFGFGRGTVTVGSVNTAPAVPAGGGGGGSSNRPDYEANL